MRVVTAVAALTFSLGTPLAAQQPRALAPGQPQSSRLGAAGDSLRSGRPYQIWTVRVDSPMVAEIAMRSAAFDAYLVLQDSAGRFLAFDDNGAGGRDARLVQELTPGRRYRVLARSVNDSTGDYSLELRRLNPATEGVVGTLTRNQTVTGTLSTGLPTVSGGRPYQAYAFEGNAGDSVTIDLSSDAFDTYLIVQDAVGRSVAENDDFGGELHSHLVFVVPSTGRYRIVATAFSRESTGAYRLRVQ
jgi:serine protease Do